MVEQRIENPCVVSSTLTFGTMYVYDTVWDQAQTLVALLADTVAQTLHVMPHNLPCDDMAAWLLVRTVFVQCPWPVRLVGS